MTGLCWFEASDHFCSTTLWGVCYSKCFTFHNPADSYQLIQCKPTWTMSMWPMSGLLVWKPVSRVEAKCLQGEFTLHYNVLVASDIYCIYAMLCHGERPHMHSNNFSDNFSFVWPGLMAAFSTFCFYSYVFAAVAPHVYDLQNYEYEWLKLCKHSFTVAYHIRSESKSRKTLREAWCGHGCGGCGCEDSNCGTSLSGWWRMSEFR